jgi:hypothetical protein
MQQYGTALYTTMDTILHANEESLRVYFMKSIMHNLMPTTNLTAQFQTAKL